MLVEFSCENYKSINKEVKLSMLATKDSTYENTLYKFNKKIKILPMASIYGANSAGKTNIITALGYVQFLIRKSTRF